MASPRLQSFCCMSANISEYNTQANLALQSVGFSTYNVLCIVSSSLSIIGATYQLWPKAAWSLPQGRRESAAYLRQNCIICCLAIADLFASTGIFLRSSIWLSGHIPEYTNDIRGRPDFAHLFCAISSGWIQYCYNCTYFWTFCYALDTYLISINKKSCEHTLGHLIPHYLSSYIPILLVMISNPILYYKVSHSVHVTLLRRGRYTNHERHIMSSINEKFFLVIVIFYICWLPNILNGVLMIFHQSITLGVFIGLWQFMALMNPVQALLNVLVYRSTGGLRCSSINNNPGGDEIHVQGTNVDMSTEKSPLLAYRT
ncbi:hypothetical protein LSH36_268g00026 [Paralvinella palmiformis]|uniref:G-protein coupled receptors family 1 profile domain-containing protein n=1 Tax=Paralvinella palmiformis TaxID=53620 RepID=A0AAD9JL61_9ANNE|nr:hypothetical protein LSH36_268g00026 [Paralvinella palmiformis]